MPDKETVIEALASGGLSLITRRSSGMPDDQRTHYVGDDCPGGHGEPTLVWVYIGRPSIHGNRFIVGVHGTREECVAKDREWIWRPEQAEYREQVKRELKGKRLWCPGCRGSLPCHRTVREEIANAE